MKGITPVVAVVLLLLITVAIVGFVFGFFQKILGIATEKTEEQTQSQTGALASTISIDNVYAGGVAVRNTGSASLNTSILVVYVNSVLSNCTWSSATIAAGGIASCTKTSFCATGDSIKVTGLANKVTETC
ncbi:MAG: hypothetical protein HZB66_00095 [Candidatus Aenigmarchaeota archaeon]|nr:hypothetical protein [Candidatus Aenigmarchaeota archaeon]